MAISSPKFLTQKIHAEVLNNLRLAVEEMKSTPDFPPTLRHIRVRNWLFLYEEGQPTVDIILDKGYNPSDIDNNLVPRFANTSLSFDECSYVHSFLLSTPALDALSDDVCVRVGSPGGEPTLHDVEDFRASLGNMVKIETWEPIDERSKFTMLLVDIFEKEGNSVASVGEGTKRFDIPLANIRSAFTLPFHPASKSVKQAKKAPKNKVCPQF